MNKLKYEYGVEYETNGEKPDLPDDVLIEVYHSFTSEWLPYNRVGVWMWGKYTAKFRIVDDRYKTTDHIADVSNMVDNDWHERGELPPIGTFCEVNTNRRGNSPMWGRCKFLGVEDGYVFWLEWNSDKVPCPCREDLDKVVGIFRPIRAERDVLVDKMVNIFEKAACKQTYSMKDGMKALLDAGWRPFKQQTEDEFCDQAWDECAAFKETAELLYRAGCRFIGVGTSDADKP